MKRLMKLLIIILFSTVSAAAYSQVTIGSDMPPEAGALLDLKTEYSGKLGMGVTNVGGLLLPRVELVSINTLEPLVEASVANHEEQKRKHTGLLVYNLKVDTDKGLKKGIYTWDGEQWKTTSDESVKKDVSFFYMPSFIIDTSVTGPGQPINLHAEYLRQFGSPAVSSRNAPAGIPVYPPASLYYYVTDYDESVFSDITISETGVMNYTVKAAAGPASLINIVFVVKS